MYPKPYSIYFRGTILIYCTGVMRATANIGFIKRPLNSGHRAPSYSLVLCLIYSQIRNPCPLDCVGDIDCSSFRDYIGIIFPHSMLSTGKAQRCRASGF